MIRFSHHIHERKYHETMRNWRRWRPTETASNPSEDYQPETEEMNGWRSRVTLVAIMLLAMNVHAFVMADVPNTDEGMALFHGSAAAVDYLILCCAPRFISGRLCDDTQTLCIVSVIANCVGFYAYTAYAPPIYYNNFMWGLSYVQWARLLLVGRHADFSGFGLVPGAGRGWGPENIGKAYS